MPHHEQLAIFIEQLFCFKLLSNLAVVFNISIHVDDVAASIDSFSKALCMDVNGFLHVSLADDDNENSLGSVISHKNAIFL